MQAFLFALLLFPLLLHSYVLFKRKSLPEHASLDKASLESPLSNVKNETLSDNPIVVLNVDDSTFKHSTLYAALEPTNKPLSS
jgi:hypothetical protein